MQLGISTSNKNRLSQYSLIVLYLLAIVAANVSVSIWGPSVSVVNAFLFIGFNLIARDKLHDAWGVNVKRNMALLIAVGCGVSALGGAGRIALASAVAFGLSESVDAIGYHLLAGRRKLVQQNGSNIPAALVDSLAFPVLAFGLPVLWTIVLGQFVAKMGGGFVWSLLLGKSQPETVGEMGD
jgi:hypothetical protein